MVGNGWQGWQFGAYTSTVSDSICGTMTYTLSQTKTVGGGTAATYSLTNSNRTAGIMSTTGTDAGTYVITMDG